MAKTVKVNPAVLALCAVKAERAEALCLEEIEALVGWCSGQASSLWDDMSLQEILNVYRATAEFVNFEAWAEEDWRAAYRAWNSAVISPGNKMRPRTA